MNGLSPYLGQPKIENLGVPPLGHEDICGLDVPMNDAFGVGGVEGVGHLNRQRDQRLVFEGAARDHVLQSQTIQELHRQEALALVLANLVDGANVWDG